MNIRNTKIWKFAQNKKSKYLMKKHYKKCLKMDEREYEDYLVLRYREMMNRRSYCAGSELHFDNPITFPFGMYATLTFISYIRAR